MPRHDGHTRRPSKAEKRRTRLAKLRALQRQAERQR
jgi:hypothetical protein